MSNNVKYGKFFKESIFNHQNQHKRNDTHNNVFIKYLNRAYKPNEFKIHSNKQTKIFEQELYDCPEFLKINKIEKISRINFNEFKRIKDLIILSVPIIFNYHDIIALSKLGQKQWDTYIKNINYNSEYYYNMKYNYTYNEIIGIDTLCAIQISGHLRYYNEVYNSFNHLNSITNLHYFMFIWNDSIGYKYTNRKVNEVTNSNINTNINSIITDCVNKFKPIKYETNNNTTFFKRKFVFSWTQNS